MSAERLTAAEARDAIAAGRLTSEQLVSDCLARIAARDGEIRAWAHIGAQTALQAARRLDQAPSHGRGLLHGIPVAIKDTLDTYDMPTRHGSVIYKDAAPAHDAACVAALRRAGAVILGKARTTEFASPIPVGVRNPIDFTRTPGVSSSGSAAAVADCMVPLALGTQTGGSVIRPAAYCGLFGYKASLEGFDRGGIRHLRPSLDTLGLFARSIADIALLRAAIVGRPPDGRSRPRSGRPRLGLCRTPQWSLARPETKGALTGAANRLRVAGAELSDVELPECFNTVMDAFGVISTFEGYRSLQREYRDHPETMNPWLREAAEKARSITEDDYQAALAQASACRDHFASVFGEVDALITPATAGEASQQLTGLEDQTFCPLWTLMHTPAVTVPAFKGPNGMPMGLQVVGPVHGDDALIAVSAWIAGALAPLPTW